MAKSENKDLRGDHYWSQVKKHGSKYREFNWPSVMMLMNLIYTCDVVAANSARKMGAFGITRAGFSVLMILSRSQLKACKQNEISQLMLVSRANITGLVDSLVHLGLVERTNDPHDRRVNLIRIMPKGEKLLEDLLPGYYKNVQDICSVFTVEEKKKFCEHLKRLRDRINEIKN
jgi:MarR family 2-MHQ and catechol resistance regulon transcriptional repressor